MLLFENKIQHMKNLIMKPFTYNDLCITLLDIVSALHNENWCVESHFHPWFEFNYVSSGAVYTTIEGTEFLIEKGQFYIIPPGKTHSHRNYNNMGDDGFCLRWQLSKIEIDVPHIGIADDIINTLSTPHTRATDMDIENYIANDKNNTVYMQSLLIHIISDIYSDYNTNENTEAIANSKNDRLVNQALIYMSQYYHLDTSAKDIATSLNISYRHLARVFKNATGIPLIKKLNDIRINEAKRMLIETDDSINEIATAVGFENEFYFSNIFKKYSLISPSKFRNLNK